MASKAPPNLSMIPAVPGVYLMKDENGRVLYVGKAISLRNRVRSYFQGSTAHSERIALMVSLAAKVDFIVTKNEVEALILENNLIKEENPPFNVMLRDDKTYPYLKLTLYEKFPRILIVRKVLKDGGKYFGPYVSAKSVRTVKALIQRIFPLRLSTDNLDTASPRRPCLNFHMKRCLAPCAGKVTHEDYAEMVESVTKFLEGKDKEVLSELESRMLEASERQEYERAAVARDQLSAIRNIHERQRLEAVREYDEDYIASLCEGGIGIVRVMIVRRGKLIGHRDFTFKKADDPAELSGAFIEQFYGSSFSVPSEVVVNIMPYDSGVIEEWLSGLKGRKVPISLPQRGRKKELIEMSLENARYTLVGYAQSQEAVKEALGEIKNIVGMEQWPASMEAIDISNISGVSAVGSLVTFFNGSPSKKDYKRYRITVSGPDDYAMIGEVVGRRFKRLKDEGKPFPDLLLIDGGTGQVSAAAEAVKEFAPQQVIIGIAKGEERSNPETDRIFRAGIKEALPFPAASAGKFMLQRLRDEAHRFAIQYHRKTRENAAFSHEIDTIVGVGPKRKKILIRTFGSIKAAKSATVEEIRKALSVSENLAREILEKI